MAHDKTVTVELYSVTRLNNSVNGNPRWELHTSEGTFKTSTDSAVNYDVDNFAHRIRHGDTVSVELWMTRAGRVWDMRAVRDESEEN